MISSNKTSVFSFNWIFGTEIGEQPHKVVISTQRVHFGGCVCSDSRQHHFINDIIVSDSIPPAVADLALTGEQWPLLASAAGRRASGASASTSSLSADMSKAKGVYRKSSR